MSLRSTKRQSPPGSNLYAGVVAMDFRCDEREGLVLRVRVHHASSILDIKPGTLVILSPQFPLGEKQTQETSSSWVYNGEGVGEQEAEIPEFLGKVAFCNMDRLRRLKNQGVKHPTVFLDLLVAPSISCTYVLRRSKFYMVCALLVGSCSGLVWCPRGWVES